MILTCRTHSKTGLGFLIWAQVQALLMDIVYRKLKERYGGVGKPEYRILLLIPGSIFLPVGLLIYGYGAQSHAHWIVLDIGLFLIAAGMISAFQSIQTYLIDVSCLASPASADHSILIRSIALSYSRPLDYTLHLLLLLHHRSDRCADSLFRCLLPICLLFLGTVLDASS